MEQIKTQELADIVPKIFFSAGEPSGDIHAASLISEIRRLNPAVECVGYGGPEMQRAGCTLLYDMTQMAIMWFARIAARFFQFRNLVKTAEKYFVRNNVKVVVLVDFPGFNWWIAAAAKKHKIPVYYYMPPQIWAWAQWRVKKMHKYVDTIFTCLPFETNWYGQNGCRVIEIGHPFIEEAKHQVYDPQLVQELQQDDRPILAILPGSRDQEITNNLREILRAVKLIVQQCPEIKPMIGAFKDSQVATIQRFLNQAKLSDVPILVRKTQELIRTAHVCIAVSGSVSMELMVHRVPTVIYYRLNPVAHYVQRWFRRVRYITLVNLLGTEILTPREIYIYSRLAPYDYSPCDKNEMVFPEYLTSKDDSQSVASEICYWMKHPQAREDCRNKLALIHDAMKTKANPFSIAAGELLQRIPVVSQKNSLFSQEESLFQSPVSNTEPYGSVPDDIVPDHPVAAVEESIGQSAIVEIVQMVEIVKTNVEAESSGPHFGRSCPPEISPDATKEGAIPSQKNLKVGHVTKTANNLSRQMDSD